MYRNNFSKRIDILLVVSIILVLRKRAEIRATRGKIVNLCIHCLISEFDIEIRYTRFAHRK